MPYTPNIPLAGDAKSASQPLILANFQYLNDLVNGVNNFIMFPEQAAAPVTAANQMALYTKAVAGVTAMFLRPEGAGTEVDFTTAVKAGIGKCTFPCGIRLKWGYSAMPAHTVNVPIAFTSNFTTTCYTVMLTVYAPVAGDPRDFVLHAIGRTNAGFTASRSSSYDGHAADFMWFAIGD